MDVQLPFVTIKGAGQRASMVPIGCKSKVGLALL